MKTKLIIANWLFSWIPLCYCGNDPVIAAIIVGWFGLSSWLMQKNKREVYKVIDGFEKWIDRIINN